jgi:S-adenosylmethionine:tRNA ribosyltransferase-isomerase
MMVVARQRESIEHYHIRDLPQFLGPLDTLVLNETRVIPARLEGHRTSTGGRWQGLFLSADEQGTWCVLGKTRGTLRPGETVTLHGRDARDALLLTMLANLGGGHWAARPSRDQPPLELLEEVGRVPLPGYIRDGQMVERDRESYQTVFATQPGAVAAPTAGLHFTQALLSEIERRGVAVRRVTLHVGIGTFRPLTAQRLEDHIMHSEWCCISSSIADELNARRKNGGRIVAVGTTVVRTLESASRDGAIQAFQGETTLFIRPPYQFQAVDALLTNFHLPRSTLLVLVRTFGGDELIRAAYEEAIRESYRFYSYGDAMLVV